MPERPATGDRVRWTFTDTRRRKIVTGTIEGVVVDRPTNFGRLAVIDDDGNEHHVQPDFVEVVS